MVSSKILNPCREIDENKTESRNIGFEADMKFSSTSFSQEVYRVL